eukprot:CAMPEP_0183722510 /NCGR_PEP_ID=MMETSP0737-20130205/14445_1 /TAXON_ID=385413 /ORGANISM="Thalassiosira miniscula, Strain CCMP1093" /LENGTH=182 /DNA_ID=CAMNT_0025952687 /DNA_START=112 /DNA_END=660 /DNA_ORIENTATION=-
MGKKSRRVKGSGAGAGTPQQIQPGPSPAPSTSTPAAAEPSIPPPQSQPQPQPQTPIIYASDGPSDVEILQTTSQSLQSKLDQLATLGLANDREAFVSEFVPLDLPPADAAGYLQDLTTAPEAEGQWRNLVAEIAAIRSGRGVDRIEGDQVTNAVFYFRHPLLEACDREVGFVCVDGEWRAEG